MLTDGSGTHDRTRSRGDRRLVLVTLVAVVAGVWWLWPTLAGGNDDVDVLVVGDGMLAEARRSIELRVREEGYSVAWYESSRWCERIDTLDAIIDELEPARVVVEFAGVSECIDDSAAAIGDVDGVAVVASGGLDPAALESAGFRTLDPTRLIGTGGGPVSLPCEWWEQPCEPLGTMVRGYDGSLTEAGAERLARMLAATL